MTQLQLKNHEATSTLEYIRQHETGTIRAFVAREALAYSEIDPTTMFFDLTKGGCRTGVIKDLIRYTDTYAFFDEFYHEIETMRLNFEDSIGEPLTIKGDLKNFLAWFAFEETAFQMARNDLGLEL